MRRSQARWLAALACVIALSAGCSTYSDTRSASDQQRERDNEPQGMKSGGGGGGY